MDFPRDAHIATTADIQRQLSKPLDEKVIAIRDDVDAHKWFVWGVEDSRKSKMADQDELKATCVEKAEGRVYMCERKVAGSDYLLGYAFVVTDGMPTEFDVLDKQVMDRIEAFRCKGQ
jgi:hypothetical protein